MKQFCILLVLVAATTACQHQAPPATKAAPAVTAPTAAKAMPAKPADLVGPMRTLLRRYNLAALWNDPKGQFQQDPVLNGFWGARHQHLALAINTVRRDSLQPQLFWVTGKTRLHRVVTPFAGTITITKIIDLQDGDVAPGEAFDSTNFFLYTATSRFSFRQLGKGGLAGEFAGQAFFDFMIERTGALSLATTMMTHTDDKFPARGCGMVLRGRYANPATRQYEPVLLARDIFAISSELFPDFGVGDRGTMVNPKYAKLGWDEEWDNNEWWADAPKPHLNL